jgi:hypothetical protein
MECTMSIDKFDLEVAKKRVDQLRAQGGKAEAESVIDQIVRHLKEVTPTPQHQAAAVERMASNQKGHCDNLRDLVRREKRSADELYLQVQWLPALEAAAITMREVAQAREAPDVVDDAWAGAARDAERTRAVDAQIEQEVADVG